MIERHERRVDDDAEGDEQIDERIHDEKFNDVSNLIPVRVTVPTKQQLHQLLLQKLLFIHALLVAKPA